MSHVEREIKLVVLPGQAVSWAEVEACCERCGLLWDGEAWTSPLRATYFDPATLGPGRSLRARWDGRLWTATAKGPGQDPWSRQEVEAPLEVLPSEGSALPAALATVLGRTTWPRPLFETAISRVARRGQDPCGHRIEIVLDEGVVRAGGAEDPVYEIEIEDLGTRGHAAIVELAVAMGRALPVRPGLLTKAGRGMRLLGRSAPDSAPVPGPVGQFFERVRTLEASVPAGVGPPIDRDMARQWWGDFERLFVL